MSSRPASLVYIELEDSQGYIAETLSQNTNPHYCHHHSGLGCFYSLGSYLLTSSSPTTSCICHSCPRDARNRDRTKRTLISGGSHSGSPSLRSQNLYSCPHRRGTVREIRKREWSKERSWRREAHSQELKELAGELSREPPVEPLGRGSVPRGARIAGD